MAEKAAPYVHPRLAAERHEVRTAPPQVVLYIPDNGRDPAFVNPIAGQRVEANGLDQDAALKKCSRDH
jgi:hypothetical protein